MTINLDKRFERINPLEHMEVAVVRGLVERPDRLAPREAAALRYALNLARVECVPEEGRTVDLEGALDEFHARVVEVLEPLLLETPGAIDWRTLREALPVLHTITDRTRKRIVDQQQRVSAAALDHEVCRKALITVAGGGGGSGYVYMGAFKLIDDMGLVPKLLVGTSMGSIISLFRARHRRFDLDEAYELARGLKFREVFMQPTAASRYGVPASLRLYLRKGIGRHFMHESGERALWMEELGIPMRVVAAGIGKGDLSRDLDYYEHLMDEVVEQQKVSPSVIRRQLRRVFAVIAELVKRPRLREVVIGGDEMTRRFDVVDAVGFSSAVPALIHYDIWRQDDHMHTLMSQLLEQNGINRLVDGGVVNNVPSRVAWESVQRGDVGTQNAFILAMDCFAPQLTRNLMAHPLQRLIRPQVSSNARYAGFTKNFRHVLSPLELVPEERKLSLALRNGYRELARERRFIREMMKPITGLDFLHPGLRA
ncbi:MAG: patatin-like phospholipase family protein [Bradymonadia bacterium]